MSARPLRLTQRVLALALACATAPRCVSDRSALGPPEETVSCDLPLGEIRRGAAIVLIRDFTFMPDTVRIRAGGTVVWVNCEAGAAAEPHTATASDMAWTSPLLERGGVFTRTFAEPGVYDYTCLPHSVMRGVVRVE